MQRFVDWPVWLGYCSNINYGLYVATLPNGHGSEYEGHFQCFAYLRFPMDVIKMDVSVTPNYSIDGDSSNYSTRFDTIHPDAPIQGSYFEFSTLDIHKKNSFSITIQLEIIELYDMNNAKIPKDKWDDYK